MVSNTPATPSKIASRKLTKHSRMLSLLLTTGTDMPLNAANIIIEGIRVTSAIKIYITEPINVNAQIVFNNLTRIDFCLLFFIYLSLLKTI